MSNYIYQNKKLLLHIAFWLMYASFFFYQISFSRRWDPEWGRILPDFAFHMIGLMGISYLNYFVFLPDLLRSQRLGRYLVRFLPVFILFCWLFLLGKRYILSPYVEPTSWVYTARFAIQVSLSSLFIVVFVGLLRFVEDYFELEARRKEMENQQLVSELRFLKAQVNPHFLFNTLNNLYYLAVNQAPNTPDVVAKLSGMMRYMLYDSNHATVPLTKEIDYMENYLSLERLRMNDEVPITFEVSGEVEGARIVPLILITFLENAFKHGIGNGGITSWITVKLHVDNGHCRYVVKNGKIPDSGKTVTEKSGIGLKNVRRRLELSYPDRHELTVNEDDDTYAVTLDLEL